MMGVPPSMLLYIRTFCGLLSLVYQIVTGSYRSMEWKKEKGMHGMHTRSVEQNLILGPLRRDVVPAGARNLARMAECGF